MILNILIKYGLKQISYYRYHKMWMIIGLIALFTNNHFVIFI
jgi:hypothetical protein